MVSLLLTAVLVTVSAAEQQNSSKDQDYAAAYRTAQQEGKPLMVVVGADWCPACVNLKATTLTSLAQTGQLEDVSVAVVDQDAEPELAAQLKQGQTIPQIIVFSQTDSGWKRTQLTGFQSQGPVRSLIDSARRIGRRVLTRSRG